MDQLDHHLLALVAVNLESLDDLCNIARLPIRGIASVCKYELDCRAKGANLKVLLTCACHGGHAGIVRMLLLNHKDIDLGDGLALIGAVDNGHTEVVQALLNHMDLNAIRMAMLTAWRRGGGGSAESFDLLLKHHAANHTYRLMVWITSYDNQNHAVLTTEQEKIITMLERICSESPEIGHVIQNPDITKQVARNVQTGEITYVTYMIGRLGTYLP